MMDLFLINMQPFTSKDVNWWTEELWITCGLLWCFYQLSSAVKRLIVINRIQNKSFCLHNMSVYCAYLLCIYKYKHMHAYI